jgi:hypothetical protein
MTACQKDEQDLIVNENKQNVELENGMIRLGKKLDNPYSVDNMRKAYQQLKDESRLKSGMVDEDVIKTSHYYVRFLPKNSLENSILLNDTVLELFTYPLDYEIEGEGVYYENPANLKGSSIWLYTVVPVDYSFPDVEYEVLEECFIPDEDSEESTLKSKGYTNFLAELEYTAMEITGNLSDEEKEQSNLKSTQGWRLPSKREPRGQIQVEDVNRVWNAASSRWENVSSGAFQGVMRVKVRAHRVVKIKSAWTDDNGNYHIDKGFRYNVHYSLIFENQTGFKIWGNWAFFAPAHYNMGCHSKNGHNRNISNNSKAWLWSTINNASLTYRQHCSALGITAPPSNLRIWNMRVNGDWAGSAPMARHISLSINSLMDFLTIGYPAVKSKGWTVALSLCMPDIFILHNGDESTREVYETVYHECGHASHYQRVGKGYWLKYIGHIVSNGGYGDGDEGWAGYAGVGEIWGNYYGSVLGRREFGGGLWWSWDEFEDWYHPGFFMRLDDWNGFTEQELFNCLNSNVNTINRLRDELISRYPAQTAAINARFGEMY